MCHSAPLETAAGLPEMQPGKDDDPSKVEAQVPGLGELGWGRGGGRSREDWGGFPFSPLPLLDVSDGGCLE